jgi:hypothetical protein
MQEIYRTLFIYENTGGRRAVVPEGHVLRQCDVTRMVGRPPLFPSVSLYASSFIYEPFAQFSPTHME